MAKLALSAFFSASAGMGRVAPDGAQGRLEGGWRGLCLGVRRSVPAVPFLEPSDGIIQSFLQGDDPALVAKNEHCLRSRIGNPRRPQARGAIGAAMWPSPREPECGRQSRPCSRGNRLMRRWLRLPRRRQRSLPPPVPLPSQTGDDDACQASIK